MAVSPHHRGEIHDDLASLPAKIEFIEELASRDVMAGEQPTAADFQIGATIRVLLTVGDLRPLLDGSAAERVARRYFPEYPGEVPQGAYPAGWGAGRVAEIGCRHGRGSARMVDE